MFTDNQFMAQTARFYGHEISNSLRFDAATTPFLNFTPGSASNLRTWTWSGWLKKNTPKEFHTVFAATTEQNSGNSHSYIAYYLDDLYINDYTHSGSTTNYLLITDAKFRDPLAWQHVVFALDTTQATASNRAKLYVNGVQVTSFSTETYPAEDFDGKINSTLKHFIGNGFGSQTEANNYDGYLADVNFIDGLQLGPSSFGELKNDIWISKDTSGLTFGTNGFRQQYKQVGTGTASSSTIGADTSGETNHYTSNNLTASDVVLDSPTNNFCTLNPLRDRAGSTGFCTFAEGNLKSGNEASTHAYSTFTTGKSGKWYFEVGLTAHSGTHKGIVELAPTDDYGEDATLHVGFSFNGNKNVDQSYGQSYGSAVSVGDIVGVAVDVDGSSINFYVNNSAQGAISHDFTDYIIYNAHASGSTMTSNFGQDSSFAGTENPKGNADGNGIGDFYYAPPSGFLALCTSNLPDPVATIDPAQGGSPQDYFNTVLYTGNASTSRAIDVGFSVNWAWIKQRSSTAYHQLSDSVRGANKQLFTNADVAENTTTSNMIKSFDSNGITIGDHNGVNTNNATYVAWNWKAGTAFSNDASSTGVGTIDSAGSVNTDVGFSIINYTGTGATSQQTISCGLSWSNKEKLVIIKNRDAATNWLVNSTILSANKVLRLNTSDNESQVNSSGYITYESFGFRTYNGGTGLLNVNNQNFICYCFHEVDGYSKFGSYIGNGNANGTFIYTGFKPAWIMIKNAQTTDDNWYMADTKRNPNNVVKQILEANNVLAEYTTGSNEIDILSNGIKCRNTGGNINVSGEKYIYMAFSEQSFKYANAR